LKLARCAKAAETKKGSCSRGSSRLLDKAKEPSDPAACLKEKSQPKLNVSRINGRRRGPAKSCGPNANRRDAIDVDAAVLEIRVIKRVEEFRLEHQVIPFCDPNLL
jgi:hypothetical protein